MSTELQLLVAAIGLISLVSLHLLVIGVFMGLMTHKRKYWRMFAAGLWLAFMPLAVWMGYELLQPEGKGIDRALALTGLLLSLLVMLYSTLVLWKGQLQCWLATAE
ncbi:hypothetical protein [Oceanobacter mangrovi]|uniref:hypothetical protein n=1 Tax=Oceanobacter mangrovi TaxID=2862510 RepID=UPI001C8DC99D|nr:hypothetical protein [Oceanobacter mangrovi]